MRNHILIGSVLLAGLTGCGLENLFSNIGRPANERPASTVRGAVPWSGAAASQFRVLDGDANAIEPFQASASGSTYELRLPSTSYAMIRVQGGIGNAVLRALVPGIGEESTASGVDLDARQVTENLIVEAWLSAKGKSFRQLNAGAYLGDGVTTGTRTLIRKDFDVAGPAQDLLHMVERVLTRIDPSLSGLDFDFFEVPVLNATFDVTASPLGTTGWLNRIPLDYDGDGTAERDSTKFDLKLKAVAARYRPDGCPDPGKVRVLFTADFNANSLDGNCATANRFKWANDKPGKQLFFVGWIHEQSPIQDGKLNLALGAGVPNQLAMYDDGTNGDEVSGDGIWTIAFDLPRALRVGYKFTWGLRGQPWTGSEEWPGNSRLLEVVDVNGDGFVYRRDVFGDEATNKDKGNLNNTLSGSTISWTTDLHGCGPEVQEQRYTLHSMCVCGADWITPQSVGPLTVACTGP